MHCVCNYSRKKNYEYNNGRVDEEKKHDNSNNVAIKFMSFSFSCWIRGNKRKIIFQCCHQPIYV